MGVEILHYRPWRGSFHGPWLSVWPIARISLGMIFRRKLFWFVYALGLCIFLLFFFGQYLLAYIETQAAESNVSILGFRDNPQNLIRFLRGILKLDGSADTYANFFWYQGYIVMVVLAMAGSILVGNDFHFGSLPFFLSKPLSRWHYLLGKALAVAVFINLMTTAPALVLFIQYGFLDSWSYYWDSRHLLAGILGYGMALTVSLSLLLVATSSWLRRTVPLIMVWTIVLFFFRLMSRVLVDGLHYDARWRLIDLWNSLYLVGCRCLGMDHEQVRPRPQPVWYEAVLVLGVACLVCVSYLNLRTRAVEIVK
jgi:ABC-type transport system involved in multi-copper enzyme maturation permease subunit